MILPVPQATGPVSVVRQALPAGQLVHEDAVGSVL